MPGCLKTLGMGELPDFPQNMLRKVSYREHYQDHDILWTDPPDVFRNHLGE